MLGLPKSTEFNKRIPKQKFYENISVTPAMKRIFVEQIKNIVWKNKIATSTLNVAAGTNVEEVEFFEVKLDKIPLDEAVLRQIDKEIPYHIIFLLEYEGKYQAWTAYKEHSSGNNAFKVTTYYHTDWLEEEEIQITIDGLNLDAVYENFVRQIAGSSLKPSAQTETLAESVAKDEQRKALQKKIENLQNKIRKEKQFNKQVEMNAELKRMTQEYKKLIGDDE